MARSSFREWNVRWNSELACGAEVCYTHNAMILKRVLFFAFLVLAPVLPLSSFFPFSPAMMLSAADQPAVNTICPVTGKAVDTSIPAVIVTVGKGERAKRVAIAVADRAAAEKVKANPSAYVEAAKTNQKAK
jgi:hypothetical protein